MRGAKLIWLLGRTAALSALAWVYTDAQPRVEGICATGCTVKADTNGEVYYVSCDAGKPGKNCSIGVAACIFGSNCS